ncbi:MAG: DUF4440 domain-containing protein [Acidimicrobiia bacterium]|nr:DUF4440 domain-containing protein [Acidimicrobiia bacterium]
MIDRCFEEIRSLHTWFGDWFAGEIPPNGLERFSAALADDFVMVTPAGRVLDRETVVGGIAEARGARHVDIRVSELHVHWQRGDLAAVQYVEHQHGDGGPIQDRVTTAVFEPHGDAPTGVRWLLVHETWRDETSAV